MYFTLHSVLSYFKGFKQALFNVIFYPNADIYEEDPISEST